jgi:serine phosphatase RsbU (regulator of sigma subunit)
MESVASLGQIALAHPESGVEARSKIRLVAMALTDAISATRLGTAISEFCRLITQSSSTAVLRVDVESAGRRDCLIFLFEDCQPLPSTPVLERFFDQVDEPAVSELTYALRAVAYLPDGTWTKNAGEIKRLQGIIAQKSRDELMSEVRQKNRELEHHRDNLEETVQERTAQLTEALGLISDSIAYASRIQRAILPPKRLMSEAFSEHFVIWEPRDVVGGDIFWCRRWLGGILLILADCTGHGVPGAFMTLIANDALDNAQSELTRADPSAIIQRMHFWIWQKLNRDVEEHSKSNDGLELGVCYLHPETPQRLLFSGARQSLFCASNGEMQEIKGDKIGIGYADVGEIVETETHLVELTQSTALYMVSDGIIDQIGGAKRRGFGKRRFIETLLGVQDQPLSQQREALLNSLNTYQARESRRDDVTALGFKNFRG